MDEDIPLLDTDPASVRAKAYDIILNGVELGDGSIRIYDTENQTKMFEVFNNASLVISSCKRKVHRMIYSLAYTTKLC